MDLGAAPIPVTVVTGFLGAGKTTLLDRWLRAFAPGAVAVIVNELGAVGLDGELLRARVERLLEITGGCVCCTTSAELLRALRELAATAPGRIVVETSGAASPAGVVRAIHAVEDVRLDGVVTVVDAAAPASDNRHAADLAAEQLGYADAVVLAHADRVSADALASARLTVARANPAAVVVASSRGVLREHDGLETLLAARTGDLPFVVAQPHDEREHAAIEAVVLTAGELDEERFGDWMERELARLAGRLFRLKGIVAIAGVSERAVLQGVADRMEVSFGAPWDEGARASRLVVIGYGLDADDLQRGFAACAA